MSGEIGGNRVTPLNWVLLLAQVGIITYLVLVADMGRRSPEEDRADDSCRTRDSSASPGASHPGENPDSGMAAKTGRLEERIAALERHSSSRDVGASPPVPKVAEGGPDPRPEPCVTESSRPLTAEEKQVRDLNQKLAADGISDRVSGPIAERIVGWQRLGSFLESANSDQVPTLAEKNRDYRDSIKEITLSIIEDEKDYRILKGRFPQIFWFDWPAPSPRLTSETVPHGGDTSAQGGIAPPRATRNPR